MDSEDDGFPKQGGEAIEIGDDFDSEEEELEADKCKIINIIK